MSNSQNITSTTNQITTSAASYTTAQDNNNPSPLIDLEGIAAKAAAERNRLQAGLVAANAKLATDEKIIRLVNDIRNLEPAVASLRLQFQQNQNKVATLRTEMSLLERHAATLKQVLDNFANGNPIPDLATLLTFDTSSSNNNNNAANGGNSDNYANNSYPAPNSVTGNNNNSEFNQTGFSNVNNIGYSNASANSSMVTTSDNNTASYNNSSSNNNDGPQPYSSQKQQTAIEPVVMQPTNNNTEQQTMTALPDSWYASVQDTLTTTDSETVPQTPAQPTNPTQFNEPETVSVANSKSNEIPAQVETLVAQPTATSMNLAVVAEASEPTSNYNNSAQPNLEGNGSVAVAPRRAPRSAQPQTNASNNNTLSQNGANVAANNNRPPRRPNPNSTQPNGNVNRPPRPNPAPRPPVPQLVATQSSVAVSEPQPVVTTTNPNSKGGVQKFARKLLGLPVVTTNPTPTKVATTPTTNNNKTLSTFGIIKRTFGVIFVVSMLIFLVIYYVVLSPANKGKANSTTTRPIPTLPAAMTANSSMIITLTQSIVTTATPPVVQDSNSTDTAASLPAQENDGLVDLVVDNEAAAVTTTDNADDAANSNSTSTVTSTTPALTQTSNNATVTSTTAATTLPIPTPTPTSYPNPQKVALARIGVNASVEPANIVPVPGSKTALEREIPAHAAGHHTDSPDCGEEGVSIIAGHNYWGGEGVFYALHDARPGDIVNCTASSGTVYHYQVISLTQYTPDDTSWYKLPTNDTSTFGVKNHYLILYTCTWDFKNRIAVLAKQLV